MLESTPPIWAAPATCAVDLPSDLPRMVFDDEARTLWLVAKNGGIRINVFKNCQALPGDPICRETAQIGPLGPDVTKFGMAVNPCSSDLVLVYRDASFTTFSADVRMRFFTNDGKTTGKNFVLRSGHQWTTNAGCGPGVVRRCGQGSATCGAPTASTCLRMNGMPSVATVEDRTANKCYAAVAYDAFFNGFIKSRLEIVDITNQSNPEIVRSWLSADPSFQWNQYLSFVVINEATRDLGWFWISDNQGPCNVGIEGAVDSNLALQNITATGKFDGTFPAEHFSGPSGINDYNQGVNGSLESAVGLYPVWGAAVCTSASCGTTCSVPGSSCTRWNLAARIARLHFRSTR